MLEPLDFHTSQGSPTFKSSCLLSAPGDLRQLHSHPHPTPVGTAPRRQDQASLPSGCQPRIVGNHVPPGGR